MRLRHAAGLALTSIAAFAGLSVSGAGWFVLAMNGLTLWFLPWWVSQFRGMPWNPQRALVAFNSIVLVGVMLPWVAICIWVYWKREGAWLDLLDPVERPARD
jgi:hypothetical protein